MIEQAVLVAFAAWRTASLLATEDGPFDVFERVRRLLGVPVTGEVIGLLPKLITCVWCVSLWTALGCWAVWTMWRPEPVMILAAAGGAIMIDGLVRRP